MPKRFLLPLSLVLLLVCTMVVHSQTTIDVKYGSKHWGDNFCDEDTTLACPAGNSPDCTTGTGAVIPLGCTASGEDIPTCQVYNTSYGVWFCVHKGYECTSSCSNDGGLCYTAHATHCSSDYWWPVY